MKKIANLLVFTIFTLSINAQNCWESNQEDSSDTLTYCSNEEVEISVASKNGASYSWAYDAGLTNLIGTGTLIELPDYTSESYYVFYERPATDDIGVLNSDTNDFNQTGIALVDSFEVLESNVVLKEAYVKIAPWYDGCSGFSDVQTYIVFDGPTYDSVLIDLNCSKFSKLNLNIALEVGEYEVRVDKAIYFYNSIKALESIPGYVIKKNGELYGVATGNAVILSGMKFIKNNTTCVSGSFYVKGESCYFSDDTCSVSKPVELVRNGDFEAGYLTVDPLDANKHQFDEGGLLDFYSDASFVGSMPDELNDACGGSLYLSQKYFVGKAEGSFYCGVEYTNHVFFGPYYDGASIFKDHTPGLEGRGFALITESWVTKTKSSNPILWEQKVAVESGQAYSFSIWRAQYDGDNSPNLGLAVVPCVDGLPVEDEKKIIKSGSGENTLMQWTQLAGDWVASSSVDSVFIRVELDISEVTGGGLIAIDDISFTNTCKNVSSQVANKFYLNKSEAELCSAGGEVPVNILNDNSTEYVYSSGNEVFWYEGKGEEQTLLDSINNKTNPVFKSPGHFRVCIKDPVNGCVINDDLIITQSLDLGTYDIELCNNNSELKTTSVKSGSKSCGVPTWAFPSGKKQTAYEIMADEVGSYSVIVGGINGYKCKSSASFNVTSQIPNAKKDTVLFCTSAPDNIYVESDNGEEFIWAYDSNMTQLIDTSSAFWLPEATEDTFNIYFKRLAQDELGVLNEDSTSFYNGGYSRFPAVDYYNILKDGVVLKELYLRTQFWESGCNATYGETGSSYIVINGPTYDSIPFDFVCGAYTKVDVNVELVPGNYEIRTGLYTVVGSIEEVGSIGGYVEQTGSDNGGVNKFYSKVKFTKANNCKAGKLLAVGEFCDFVNGSDERNQEDFSVFPNPASNAIYFNKMLDEVSLYTSNGQYISSYTNVRSISLDSLQSGVYFLRSNGLTKSIVKK